MSSKSFQTEQCPQQENYQEIKKHLKLNYQRGKFDFDTVQLNKSLESFTKIVCSFLKNISTAVKIYSQSISFFLPEKIQGDLL